MQKWVVLYVDDDEESTQKCTFDSVQDANTWIKFKENCERYEPTGFELIDGPMKVTSESLDEDMTESEKEKFYDRLHKEKVHFQYKRKRDNQLRDAYGTLIANELPPPANPKDSKKAAREKMKRAFPEDSVFYYDLEFDGFKSFKMKNFIKYKD